MDKEEFLKKMIEFGEKILTEQNLPKLNHKAIEPLIKLYAALDAAVNAAADLEIAFGSDKRALKAQRAASLIMKVQELMNPLAEDEDIDIDLHR